MSDAQAPTILLVEDNDDDVFLMKRILKKAAVNFPLHVVGDGRQAVQYLEGSGDFVDRSLHPLPVLVFLDLKLPYLRGFEVLEWIRGQKTLEALPVVILTSSAEERDVAQALKMGVPYWVKPPDPEDVKELVSALKIP